MPGCLLLTLSTSLLAGAAPTDAPGPLRVSPDNPRYFAAPDGEIVYLVGAHTWANFKDMGPTDPPAAFAYDRYLDFLVGHGHNFIRLWTWDLTRCGVDGRDAYATPFPWPRTGPGEAKDGKPRFDLSRFDQSYFDRLRQRVAAAGERGIYCAIMLFEGWAFHGSAEPWRVDGHPFAAGNNINGLNADPNGDGRAYEVQGLEHPEMLAVQEAYVRRVVETVGDLNNVLYEITNEAGTYSTAWQYHFINFIHELEASRPKQHPVGMTFQFCRENKYRGTNQLLFDSPADWISPGPDGGWRDNPPPADGRKVILTDTDHLWGIGGNAAWVWKSFCRGLNPLFMDPYLEPRKDGQTGDAWVDHLGEARGTDSRWEAIRVALGQTAKLARRLDLRRTTPRGELASSGYCLADPGRTYLVWLPDGGEVTVDLTGAGTLPAIWYDPARDTFTPAGELTGGGRVTLTAPRRGMAVLLLGGR